MIARALGISKNTVKAALRSDGPPRYERTPAGSVVDEVEPRIRALLQTSPTMPATVIAERVGWTRGMTVLSERVRELRPVYLPPDPASRTAYVAGEIAQHDFWFPDIELPVGFGQTRTAKQLPVLTMVAAYSPWGFEFCESRHVVQRNPRVGGFVELADFLVNRPELPPGRRVEM